MIRSFGTTGIAVSAIGLGAWQLGYDGSWHTGPDRDEAVRIVHSALDAGVTFIDTAPNYAGGQSEINLGYALKGRPRDSYVLCTKFGHAHEGGQNWSVDALAPSLEGSARRMGVDHLDIVVLHNPDEALLLKGDLLAELEKQRDRGLVRAFGASVDYSHEVDTMLAAGAPTALEIRLSALFQEPWPAVDRAAARGVGTIVKCPLESGWLSGRYDAGSVFTDARARWSREDIALRARLVDEFRQLLPAGVSVVDGALRFLLASPSISTVIPGTHSIDHLRASVAAATEALPQATVAAIRDWYRTRFEDAQPLGW
jgi:aryl-alcohol dehydrogenase-like predicted oxidoreductase